MSKKVAIVVPVYKTTMSPDEQISFHHLRTHLRGHDTFLMTPDDIGVTFDGLPVKAFPRKWFLGTHTYSELLVSPQFYEAFSDYEFILIYQLDCLAFSDSLLVWCQKGIDYVGAPWIRHEGEHLEFGAVGNGGLSLRNVQSALRILKKYHQPHRKLLRRLQFALNLIRRMGKRLIKGVRSVMKTGTASLSQRGIKEARKAIRESRPEWFNEDIFWSFEAPVLDPSFHIPPPEEAVAFSFEQEPRFCFERNGNKLPFGCHNWAGFDRGFWEQHIEKPREPYLAQQWKVEN